MTPVTLMLTVLSLAGTILITKQDRRGFICWMIANTGWTIVDYQAGLFDQAAMFSIYFVLAVWGFIRWKPPQVVPQSA